MATDNDRKKVALNIDTYEKLKTFSRFNGLKLRRVMDTMTELLLLDEALSKRVIDLTLEKQADEQA
jgi:hypothetical protein